MRSHSPAGSRASIGVGNDSTGTESASNLPIYFCFVDSALQDHRDIWRHQLTHFLKGKHRLETQAVMPAFGVDFTDVKLPDSVPEAALPSGAKALPISG